MRVATAKLRFTPTPAEQDAIAEFNAAVNRAYKVEAYRMVAKQLATPGAGGRYLAGMGGFTRWKDLPNAKSAEEKPKDPKEKRTYHKKVQQSDRAKAKAREIVQQCVERGDRALFTVSTAVRDGVPCEGGTARKYAKSILEKMDAVFWRKGKSCYFSLPGGEAPLQSTDAEKQIRELLQQKGGQTIAEMARSFGISRGSVEARLSRFKDSLKLVEMGKRGASKIWGLPQ